MRKFQAVGLACLLAFVGLIGLESSASAKTGWASRASGSPNMTGTQGMRPQMMMSRKKMMRHRMMRHHRAMR